MKVLVVVAILLLGLSLAEKTRWNQLNGYTFDKYVKEYNKHYNSEEEYQLRKHIFETKLSSVLQHNSDTTKTWKKGINHLSDRKETELKAMMGYKKSLGFQFRSQLPKEEVFRERLIPENRLPASVDWRTKSIVGPVKDQGMCGSCWTFATAETVESHWALKYGHLTDLSQQQILDCTPNPNQCGGTGGCGGGTTELAYQQIMQTGGLASEWTYPYISYYGAASQCQFNASTTTPMVQLASYKVLPSNEYLPLLNALANHGPIAITVDASAWSDYEHGVFDGCNQTNPDLDHGVQLVGYGTDVDYGDYWLIRNSWSPLYGENGYIRIARSSTVQCGTDIDPSDGTGCKNGPPQVTVCGTCGILYDNTFPIIQ